MEGERVPGEGDEEMGFCCTGEEVDEEENEGLDGDMKGGKREG